MSLSLLQCQINCDSDVPEGDTALVFRRQLPVRKDRKIERKELKRKKKHLGKYADSYTVKFGL